MAITESPRRVRSRVGDWLLQDAHRPHRHGPHTRPAPEHPRHPWWKVMCLTGVDYFSTLGYQPGIAALAAGVLSPVATVVLVVVTLCGALPVYRRVARESPHGEGSVAMLERLLPGWRGKVAVLVLLGFAATDFLITMTLSAADATAHLVQNPLAPAVLQGQNVPITLLLLALLGGVFLAGFSEAVRIAVGLVALYLVLNAVVVVDGLARIVTAPHVVADWSALLVSRYPDPLLVVAVALVVFPKLALGLSGFETGVSVMPLVRGRDGDTEEDPRGRIAGTRRLLTTAATIMSTFLVTSSVVTVLLIPEQEFAAGGQANGRALAYLAHRDLGNVFGTVYDLATIAILWFAGASAMAGLLNLVPRFLPRYGMAPSWARAARPLVLVVLVVAFVVTLLFDADVDAQGGAYATGVLVLMTSAAVAVALSARRSSRRPVVAGFAVIAVVFVYTTIANIVERPEGVKIAACFIGGILLVSLASRTLRAFELRVTEVELDDTALGFLDECSGDGRPLRLVAHEPRPGERDSAARDEEYRAKLAEEAEDHHIPSPERVVLVEVTVTDPSEFESGIVVHGQRRGPYRVLTTAAPSVPNAIAALLLHLRDVGGTAPHIYFDWTEGNPVSHFGRYLFTGVGEVAPITREILREAEPDLARRPVVHVG
ncbi:amino acid transporter [Pseudonocardia spirodelae]|uniref:Amino acid transporter n=1 Tax=Pseudonocardia spirodelae TaxID=3133431 RepID=A0ABU8T409_9PSEU